MTKLNHKFITRCFVTRHDFLDGKRNCSSFFNKQTIQFLFKRTNNLETKVENSSTKYSPPKDLNWKQEYINKRYLLNSKSKSNPEFYDEISQVNKHNGRIIPGEDHKNFIEGQVFPIRFLKFKYFSVEIPGFGDDQVHLYFIVFQNKLYRLVDNFVGILSKKRIWTN
jgi:hypothetical protein